MMENILIVDDNLSTIDALKQIINEKGFNTLVAANAEEGLTIFNKNNVELIITDLKLPGIDGIEFLKKVKSIDRTIPVIVVTAFGSVEKAVQAVKLGAFDFLKKPFSVDEIEVRIDKALATRLLTIRNKELSLENEYLREEFSYSFSEIIGKSLLMKQVFERIKKVSRANSPVLLLGESGTGKELVARAIHINSPRKNKPFVRVNCAALAQGVLESELFGHEKGAFSGAINSKPGRFEIAGEGSIFLDEIGDISADVQVKLLRILQEKEFERVGGTKTIKMKARVITATNRNLVEQVRQNKFREDLFYRLNVVPIVLPPLRERKEDIPLLVERFLKIYSLETKKHITKIHSEAMNVLLNYDWPGNIRELENIIERAIVLTNNDVLTIDDFPENILTGSTYYEYDSENSEDESNSLTRMVVDFEKKIIGDVLAQCGGNISRAAKNLQINRTTLRYKMAKYGLIGNDIHDATN